jgi:exopolysaccharide biosynthesis polyprenyl glycosylphosphotransferase
MTMANGSTKLLGADQRGVEQLLDRFAGSEKSGTKLWRSPAGAAYFQARCLTRSMVSDSNRAEVETNHVATLAAPNYAALEHTARRETRVWIAKAAIAVGDTVAVIGALLIATFLKIRYVALDPTPLGVYVIASAIAVPTWILMLTTRRLYVARVVSRRSNELRRVIEASMLAVAGVIVADFVLKLGVARTWVAMAGLIAVVLIFSYREVVRQVFRVRRRRGVGMRRVVIVGDNDEALAIEQLLQDDRSIGYEVVARVAQRDDQPLDDTGHFLLEDTLEAVRDTEAHGVVIAATAIDTATSNRLVRSLAFSGLHLELSSTLSNIRSERLTVNTVGRFPMMYIEPVHRFGWRPAAKRSFDIVGSLAILLVTLPLFAAIAIAIKLDSKGNVLFRQARLGQNATEFPVLKFRTMVQDAESRLAELESQNEADGPLFKLTDDPRVTRVGAFLRKTSLDELPQLLNVLRGEMSLVGPRPALLKESQEWSLDLFDRLRVRPGMTGMWQVSGRSDASFDEYSRLDLFYVDNWSLVIDVTILFKTIPAVLARRGAK